jgi:hypothetical protein
MTHHVQQRQMRQTRQLSRGGLVLYNDTHAALDRSDSSRSEFLAISYIREV